MEKNSSMNRIEAAVIELFPQAVGETWFPSRVLFQAACQTYLPFPNRTLILENAHWANLPAGWNADIIHAADSIQNSENLGLFYHLAVHLLLYEKKRYDARQFRYWPDPDKEMGSAAPIFFLLVSLSCVALVRELHRQTSIPVDITRDTCKSIGVKAHDYFFFHDEPGIIKWAVYWFQHHISGNLYRVGRLEFMLKRLYKGLSVYRKNGEMRLVCEDPETGQFVSLLPNGQRDHSGEMLRQWDCYMDTNDFILDVHIPGGGGLTLASIRDSFARALIFFDHLYPNLVIKGFECVSWIFSPDLEAAFPPKSNLIRFRDQVYVFPVKSKKTEGLNFIFGTFSRNHSRWPEKTSVQRKLKAHILAGGSFRLSGMVCPREILLQS